MKEVINAYARNPHVIRKLIRFNNFIPANIICDDKKTVLPVKLEKVKPDELLKKNGSSTIFDICYEGKHYNAKIAKISMDAANKDIDEVELAVVS